MCDCRLPQLESTLANIEDYIRDIKISLSQELSQALVCKDKNKECSVEKCMEIVDTIESML